MARSTRSSNSSTQAKVGPVEEKEIKTWGSGGLFASRDLGALLLLVLCPLFGMLVWYIVVEQKGSLRGFYIAVFHKRLGMGWWNFLKKALWVKAYPFRPRAMKIVGCYAAFEAFLQLYVPGKKFKATPTATGHIPVYKANGVACYLISIVALFALKYFRIFNPIRQAERFDPDGAFVRSMIPELAGASAKQTLEPWKFGGVGSYPKPMIDLSAARDKTLQVWKITKKNT